MSNKTRLCHFLEEEPLQARIICVVVYVVRSTNLQTIRVLILLLKFLIICWFHF